MPHETNLFSAVNRDFRILMKATEKNPNVLQACSRISKSAVKSSLMCCHRLFIGSLFKAIVGHKTFHSQTDAFADVGNVWITGRKSSSQLCICCPLTMLPAFFSLS